MSDAVITALIMAGASIICQLLINRSNRRRQLVEDAAKDTKRQVEEAVKAERLENRLKSIEHKLDEHNGYAGQLSTISQDIAVIKNDIKTLYNKA